MSKNMKMRRSKEKAPLGVNYTSKQEIELCARGGGQGISAILTHFRVRYCCPDSIIRDALVGAVDTESPFHDSASGGKEGGRDA